jgi:hypothetical protein
MSYRVSGLDPAPFLHLYGLPDQELASFGVIRCRVDARPGYPDRVELRDMEHGETALLLNYTHQPANTPYRASHAIFVREGARRAATLVDELPEVLRERPLSLRSFDAADMMVDGRVVEGASAEPEILRLLGRPDIAYIQAHYANRGCYAARIERA